MWQTSNFVLFTEKEKIIYYKLNKYTHFQTEQHIKDRNPQLKRPSDKCINYKSICI